MKFRLASRNPNSPDSHRGPIAPDSTGAIARSYLEEETHNKRYDFKSKIGEGGMGEIHVVKDQNLDRILAMKVMSPRKHDSEFEQQVRECFLLMAQKVSVKDIAQRLQLSESSVYVYKKRVQDRLQKEINRLNVELG